MGRGSSSPKQAAVIKKRPSEILQTGNSSGKSESQQDKCLFSFRDSLISSSGKSFQKGDSVDIVPQASSSSKLEIYIKNINFGAYIGKNYQKIVSCTEKGYTYEGLIESVSSVPTGINIEYFVQGHIR